MLTIRPEKTEDHAAIYEVNQLAFEGEDEARLVDALRQSDDFIPELSLVAEMSGQVVGHILFSSIKIEGKSATCSAVSLAPMSVRPEFQRQGVGSELVRQGLEKCRGLGHSIVIVLGHPNYYPRFGFSPAGAKGIICPFPAPDEAFMALELVPGALDAVEGLVKYPAAFGEVA